MLKLLQDIKEAGDFLALCKQGESSYETGGMRDALDWKSRAFDALYGHLKAIGIPVVHEDRASEITYALLSVMDERHRQIHEEGHTTENDDRYAGSYQLSRAAACYALPPYHRWRIYAEIPGSRGLLWPWAPELFKRATDGSEESPTHVDTPGRRRELVKAGALILAAIEVIDRSSNNEQR